MKLVSPVAHFQAFRDLVRLLTQNRQLTWEMTKREISDRYAGQAIGTLWAVGHPLALMAVYVFVFGFVFKARLGSGAADVPRDYITYLLSGLIPWMSFQESLGKGSQVIVANASIVKQVVFPIEVLPVKGVLASMATQTITSALLLAYILASSKALPWTALLLPALWAAQFLAMTGVSFVLSSVGAYFRDVKDFVQLANLIGMYLAPIAYAPERVPDLLRPILYANPFSYMAWCYQDALYFGRFEHALSWIVFPGGALFVFYAGFRVFRQLKTQFGNVL